MNGFEILGQLVFGWLLVDFLSGLFHWFEDEIAGEDWPLIGPAVTVPNRRHHTEPLAFLQSGVVGRGAITWGLTAVMLGGLLWVFGPQVWQIPMLVGGLLVNEAHAWAHAPRSAPRAVAVLQATGLLQAPKSHALHHGGDHNTSYCILTGWLNPLLDAVGFWRGLERGLRLRAG